MTRKSNYTTPTGKFKCPRCGRHIPHKAFKDCPERPRPNVNADIKNLSPS